MVVLATLRIFADNRYLIMNLLRWLFFHGFLFLFAALPAQQPLPEVEKELAAMAKDILLHDSLTYKISQNKAFARLMISTLQRPESYFYPWDSLPTISVLKAEDDAFRIFTWQIVDKNYREYRGEQNHYYFGLIQRRYEDEKGKISYLVIPLIDNARLTPGVENMQLDNQNWLGALYYPLKNHRNTIPAYTTKTKSMVARGDSVYILGQGWVTGEQKQRKSKATYYLLMGWNGADHQVNYKVMEALYFDPENPNRAMFGVGVFYFDQYTPRMRVLFRYQENAPFSLNMGYIRGGFMNRGKEEIVVYDQMGVPNFIGGAPISIMQAGPSGSYDGFRLNKKTGGFRWIQNVDLIDPITRAMAKEISQNQEKIIRARLAQLHYWAELMDDPALVKKISRIEQQKKLTARSVKMIRKQEASLLESVKSKSDAEQQRLKKAGIAP